MKLDRSHTAEQLCRVVRGFHGRGWCRGSSGDFSAVLQQDPLRLLITPTHSDKGEVTPENLVVVGVDGQRVAGEHGEPSMRALLHATIATLTHAGAVLHTNSVWSTILGEHWLDAGGLTITGYEMLRGLDGVGAFDAEVFVPVLANTRDVHELVERTSEEIAEWPGGCALLIAGAGLYSWGATLADAARHAEVLEFVLECIGRSTSLANGGL